MAQQQKPRFKAFAVDAATGDKTPITADMIEIHTKDGVLGIALAPQGTKGSLISMATGGIVTRKKDDHSTLGIRPGAANMMLVELHGNRKGGQATS